MDALALFCNLHGDGPETLVALRDVGCTTLRDVANLDLAQLGEILGRDASGVARFVREAGVLADRVEGEAATTPESPTVVSQVTAAEPDPEVLVPHAQTSAPKPEPPAPEPHTPEPPVMGTFAAHGSPPRPVAGPVAAAVIELWQSLDAPSNEQATQPEQRSAQPTAQPKQPPAETPKPLASFSARSLHDAELNGLKPSEVDALVRIGVETVEALAEADPLTLSQRTKLPYTHLAHLAFLARRMAQQASAPADQAGAAAEATSASVEQARQPAEQPPLLEDDMDAESDAGGPFA